MSYDPELGGFYMVSSKATMDKIQENINLFVKRIEDDTDMKVSLKAIPTRTDEFGNVKVKGHTEIWIGESLLKKRRHPYEVMVELMTYHAESTREAVDQWNFRMSIWRCRG